jgi:hypothetical protein
MRSRGGPTFVVTTTADDGPGSLRQAIFAAGAAEGVDLIAFAIPGSGPHTIAVQSQLPAILDPMTIDATTQPGYSGAPLVEIDNAAVRDGVGIEIGVGGVVIRGLSVTNADGAGISIFGEGGSVLEANYVGLGPSGAVKPNALDGVSISASFENTVGATSALARNVISGNAGAGVALNDGSGANLVVGNYIGLTPSGSSSAPNASDGVFVGDATSTVIGGAASGARNVISGNGALGVGVFDAGAAGALVLGNYVGTDAAGAAAVPNGDEGVLVQNAPDASVGGTSAGAGNLLSGNVGDGVGVIGRGASGTVISGNTIGTNAAKTAKVSNLGNGVYMEGASDVLVGGTAAGAANVISGNDALGVGLFEGTSGVRIQGNTIGLGASDAPLGNFADGVYIQDSSDNLVGGFEAGEGNTIAANGASGILVFSGVRDSILGNSFFDNAWIGIDIDEPGIATNDDGDGDGGANGGLNHPVLTWVTAAGSGTSVRGRFDSMPGETYRLELFSSDDCDEFGVGEGRRFIGSFEVTTGARGSVLFETVLAVQLAVGTVVTATATDADGNTSEFSECSVVLLAWDPPATEGGPPRNLTVNAAGASVAPASTAAPRAQVTAYKVYRAPVSPVPVTASNLFTTVPATQTTVNAPASSGGFFTVTASYSDGSESGPSNDAGTTGAPVVTGVALKGAAKLVATGSNITPGVLVIVDGIPFQSAAKLKKQGTQVVQKGPLVIQQTVRQYLASRPPGPDGRRQVLVGIRNSSGAVTTFLLSE